MRTLTFVASAILFLATAPLASAATTIANPESFVRDVYKNLQKSTDYHEPDDIYTARLAEMFKQEQHESGGEVGRIDFDFWINAQDYKLSDVKVTSQPVELAPSRKIVIAKFKNLGTAEEIHFYFEKTPSGWKLDDARSVAGEKWTLSLIVKYGD